MIGQIDRQFGKELKRRERYSDGVGIKRSDSAMGGRTKHRDNRERDRDGESDSEESIKR